MLRFRFWQPVYCAHDDSDFLSNSNEERGRFVRISESVGHQMTFKILSNASNKVIHRSNVRPANIPLEKNTRLNPLTVQKIVKLKRDLSDNDNTTTAASTIRDDESLSDMPSMPIINPSCLMGRTFLMPTHKNGQHF